MKTHNSQYEYSTKSRRLSASSLALVLFVAHTAPTFAAIENSATVSGTYGATTTPFGPATESVDVVPAAGAMTMVKTAGAPTTAIGDADIVDVGDTILYTYVVENTGNVTLNNVTPVDTGPTFNSLAATNALGAFSPAGPITLAPGASQTFTATYTIANLDAYHAAAITNGVSNTSHATGQTVLLATINSPDSTATTTIPPGPKLSISKVAVLVDTGSAALQAEVGEFIDYTYTVVNIGNVPMTDITINDLHEGSAVPVPAGSVPGTVTDETITVQGPTAVSLDTNVGNPVVANDGVWRTLQPGATATFTYHHLVTQAEVDGG